MKITTATTYDLSEKEVDLFITALTKAPLAEEVDKVAPLWTDWSLVLVIICAVALGAWIA